MCVWVWVGVSVCVREARVCRIRTRFKCERENYSNKMNESTFTCRWFSPFFRFCLFCFQLDSKQLCVCHENRVHSHVVETVWHISHPTATKKKKFISLDFPLLIRVISLLTNNEYFIHFIFIFLSLIALVHLIIFIFK